MLKFEGKLTGYEGVVYKKAKCQGGKKWLHSFRDIKMAAAEERNYLEHLKGKAYEADAYEAKRASFGTIVLRIMKNFVRAKKAKVGGGEWQLVKVNPSVEKMLAALGLDPLTDTGVQKKL